MPNSPSNPDPQGVRILALRGTEEQLNRWVKVIDNMNTEIPDETQIEIAVLDEDQSCGLGEALEYCLDHEPDNTKYWKDLHDLIFGREEGEDDMQDGEPD